MENIQGGDSGGRMDGQPEHNWSDWSVDVLHISFCIVSLGTEKTLKATLLLDFGG
jgi:hypothetical protein